MFACIFPLQFEPFIWSMMRQRPTPTCRSGMWPSWSWAATGATWTGLSSCAFGKPSTGLYLFLCMFMYTHLFLCLLRYCYLLFNSYTQLCFKVHRLTFFFPFLPRSSDTWWNTNLTSGSEPRSRRPSPTFQLSSFHLLQRDPLSSKLPSHLPTWSLF